MIRIVDGKPVHVPDDASITPQLKALRTMLSAYLQQLHAFQHSPEGRALYRQFREGRISDTDGFGN